MPGYFHISTDGRSSSVLFRDPTEFVAGMNRIYFALTVTNLVLLAFCLMDNHVHFVLYGEEDQCWTFIHRYKQLTGMWIQSRGGEPRPLDAMIPSVKPIKDDEYLRNVIVYDIMNPTRAHMPYLPATYRWCSGGLYFADHSLVTQVYRRAGDFSHTALRQILGTRITIPDDILIGPDGMIWPGCYVAYEWVNRLFGSPYALLKKMNQPIDYQINKDMTEGRLSLPDGEIVAKCRALCNRTYGVDSVAPLDVDRRMEIARRLRIETRASLKQISRVVQLRYKDVLAVLGE